MEIDFLKDLNESQRRAVEYVDGPSLVIAGAGSGKTRVLTYKIAYLLTLGINPWQILALTFTNKAAREMKERIRNLVGAALSDTLWMGTFHSLFNRMLRQEAHALGYSANYTIYQPSDCKSLVKSILREMNLDDKTYKDSVICNRISEAKNALVLPDEYRGDIETYKRDTQARIPLTGEIYQHYVTRMRQANAMDFDDLLMNTYLLFKRFPEVRRKYASKFQYILVDEYQDTNYAQHEILRQLSEGNEHICVVGDDAQSIYSFRGARIDNILKFTSQYAGAKLFKLEQNYRSTKTIVKAANSLISFNKEQIKKEIYSENEAGSPILLNVAYSDVEEGEIVCNRIQKLHLREYMPYQSMAVLFRTNAQSRIFEEGLRKRGIPYRIYGGRSFYDQKEIRDVLAYFRLIVNPDDEEALKRVINYPTRGIGLTTLSKLTHAAMDNGVSVWAVLRNLEKYDLALNSGTVKKLDTFSEMMEKLMALRETEDAYQLGARTIQESGLGVEMARSHDAESLESEQNIQELLNGMNTFVEMKRESGLEDEIQLTDYLSEVSLLSDQDNVETESQDRVTLMTVHSAKGLEFGAVFVVGMEENLFPNSMAMYSERELEEERRLFYVAITRAKNYCFLSCSKMRFRYGKMEFCEPSSFLKQIDKEYLRLEVDENPHHSDYAGTQFTSQYKKPVETEIKVSSGRLHPLVSSAEVVTEGVELQSVENGGQTLHVGDDVEHVRFGEGKIIKLEGSEGNFKAVVDFKNSGQKTLLLKYAKLTLI